MPIKVTVDATEARFTLGKVGRVLSVASVHRIIGAVMLTSINETFEQEGHPPGSWRRLHASSLAARFERGGKKKAFRRDGSNTAGFLRFARGKKILTDSGRLQTSIRPESAGSRLLIGTNLIYAKTHQEGAVIVPKKAKVLRFPVGGGRFAFAKRVVIPARPFLLFKPQDAPTMVEAIETAAAAAGEGGGR